jgi:hypothetical protein
MADSIPDGAADAAPLNYPIISGEWAGVLMGLLYPLTERSYWEGTEAEQQAAVDEVEKLQYLLMNTNPIPENALFDESPNLLTDEAGYILTGG